MKNIHLNLWLWVITTFIYKYFERTFIKIASVEPVALDLVTLDGKNFMSFKFIEER